MAPASAKIKFGDSELKVGNTGIKPGRSIPFIRPTTSKPLANKAPVFPADNKASAFFSFTYCAAITIEEPFLRRTAATGSSSLATTSSVWMMVTLSSTVNNGFICASSPNSSTSISGKVAIALLTPFTTAWGA